MRLKDCPNSASSIVPVAGKRWLVEPLASASVASTRSRRGAVSQRPAKRLATTAKAVKARPINAMPQRSRYICASTGRRLSPTRTVPHASGESST